MTMAKIEKDVPMPRAPRRGRPVKYPFAAMTEIDDSFLEPTGNGIDPECIRSRLKTAASSFRKRNPRCGKWQFATRIMQEGIRVWRVE